jgi:hypothetical protein
MHSFRRFNGVMLSCTAVMGLAILGCEAQPPDGSNVRLEIPLGENSSFDAAAGGQVGKALAITNFDPQGSVIGVGTVSLAAVDISVVEDTGSNGEADCDAKCTSNGLPAATCADVCSNGKLYVVVAIGTTADGEDTCATADKYGPFVVTLDADGTATAVSPVNAVLQTKTIAALNAADIGICIAVISPVTGTVDIKQILLDVGP